MMIAMVMVIVIAMVMGIYTKKNYNINDQIFSFMTFDWPAWFFENMINTVFLQHCQLFLFWKQIRTSKQKPNKE